MDYEIGYNLLTNKYFFKIFDEDSNIIYKSPAVFSTHNEAEERAKLWILSRN